MDSLLKNPESYFQISFDKIFSSLQNSNENNMLLRNKIKSSLKIQYKDIEKKIKECDEHIQFLNELYVQKELMYKIPLTSVEKKKFIIKNKSVLINNQHDNLYGELFGRYILSIISQPEDLKTSFIDNFYDGEKIFDIFEKDKKSLNNYSASNLLSGNVSINTNKS
jgi:hypothetical protein